MHIFEILWCWWTYLQGRNWDADIDNRLVDTAGEGDGGAESRTDICAHCCYCAKSLQSCRTLCDPIDGSPPGSPIPGILQARTLEWVASIHTTKCKIASEWEVLYSARSSALCSLMAYGVGWGGWEGHSRGRVYVNTHSWYTLLCRNHHNIVKHYPPIKNKFKK